MEHKEELNNQDLNNVSGGANLDKYLKSLAGNDKNKILVDYGTGTSLVLDSSFEVDDGDVHIVNRDKNDSGVDIEL